MSQTVAEALVDVLERVGVKEVFGLVGDSLNPLGDAIRRSSIEWIGVRHEEGAALAASGQAKFAGRLAVCAGTTGPGSNHLVAGLYEASRDHAPVLALSGEMPRKMKGTDFFQSTEPDLLFATCPSTPRQSFQRSRRPLSFAKRSLRAMLGPVSRI
jgi:pyruvate dehydrogenase (quinone)